MSLAQFERQECTVKMHLTPHERDLVAALLAHDPSYAVSVDRLIELMWPDANTEIDSAVNTIHRAVHDLRRKGLCILSDRARAGYSIVGRIKSLAG